MLIAPQEGKGAPISQMCLNSWCAYNRIVGSRVIVKCVLFRKTTEEPAGDYLAPYLAPLLDFLISSSLLTHLRTVFEFMSNCCIGWSCFPCRKKLL